MNRKVQLSLAPEVVNKSLAAEKVSPGMFLQAVVQSKEQKGYMLDLGFKDGAKGFVKCKDDNTYEIGQLVHVLVKSQGSKVVKCEFVDYETHENVKTPVQNTEGNVTIHTIKPGFFVSAKVSKIFENGLELSFMAGLTGTVFADHIGVDSLNKFKTGQKLQARVISSDVSSKAIGLTLLP